MKYRVLIVEDEPPAATRLEKLILSSDSTFFVEAKVGSVRETVQWLRQFPAPDLILMDIQLGDGISFSVFDEVQVDCPIIFTTAFNEYALRAFKVNSIDYILKPIDKEELATALEKFKKQGQKFTPNLLMQSMAQAMSQLTRKYKERFVIKVGEHLKTLEVADILYFHSQDKTTFAHSVDGRQYIIDFALEQLETLLDPTLFFRISRKYLVAARSIHDMVAYTNSRLRLVIKQSTDNDIIVARERVQEFKAWLDR